MIKAIIYYQYEPEELAELAQAIEPLMEHVAAVGDKYLLRILDGDDFRAKDARALRDLLLRGAKHARQHLGDYFPLMQQGLIGQAEQLEDAANDYYKTFRKLQNTTIPIN